MRPSSLRSSRVVYAKAMSTTLTITAALATEIHQGSTSKSGVTA
jgi:hypothetical protein